jgi:hypothetical protein
MLIDIDFSMSYKDMKKLAKLTKNHVVEKPWKGISSSKLWRGGYMELNYRGIAIEIGETKKTKFIDTKSNKWETFPDGLNESVNKKVFGLIIPVMPKNNLINYKRKLGRKIDIKDIKEMTN